MNDRLDAALHKHEGYPPGTTTRQIAAGGNDDREREEDESKDIDRYDGRDCNDQENSR